MRNMKDENNDKTLFQSFLKGETQIPSDEAFQNAVHCYAEIFLKSERVSGIVAGGGLSQHDCREIFRHQIEKVSTTYLLISYDDFGLKSFKTFS